MGLVNHRPKDKVTLTKPQIRTDYVNFNCSTACHGVDEIEDGLNYLLLVSAELKAKPGSNFSRSALLGLARRRPKNKITADTSQILNFKSLSLPPAGRNEISSVEQGFPQIPEEHCFSLQYW
jgi:hypothetical protein